MTAPTDAELLAASRTDENAFRSLYDRYAARVLRYHVRRTADVDAAHDLTAETFAQAWLARARFRDEAGGSAGPWLFAIARHVLLTSVRKRSLERSARMRLGLECSRVETEPEEAWLDGLDEALAELPDGQRQAIQLRIVDDLTYEHVADSLGTTPEAARVRVHRGLTSLRGRLASESRSTR